MSISRSKVVELSGKKFELRRLPPDIGSFIFMRMMGVSIRTAAVEEDNKPAKQAPVVETQVTEKVKKMTGEARVRALAFAVFSGGMEYADFKFVQNQCMQCVSMYNEAGMPIPIVTDSGEWVPVDKGENLSGDVGLVMQLTSAVLVHCFADFFESGGLGL